MRYTAAADADGCILTDAEAGGFVRVDPLKGNNVTAFRIRRGRDPIDLLSARGAPILFPFANRVPEGRFRFRGREYRMDVNERDFRNHIHGFVRQLPWTVLALGADDDGAWVRAAVELHRFPEVSRQYPFRCRVTVTTRLRHGALMHEASVENRGDVALPMNYGLHPWFPGSIGGARAHTQVRIGTDRYWELDKRIPTGRVLSAPPGAPRDLRDWRALGALEYDDVFTGMPRRLDGWTESGVRYPDAGITIRVEASPAFREVVVFAPTDQDVVCIEPYTAPTNAVNLTERGFPAGTVALEAGSSWEGAVRISAAG